MDAKTDAEKESKMMPKGSQTDAKMDAKMEENSMRFWNLRFLVFCIEYNVQIVFLHANGCCGLGTHGDKRVMYGIG